MLSLVFGVAAGICALALIPVGRGALRAIARGRLLWRWRRAAARPRTVLAEPSPGFGAFRGRVSAIDPLKSRWSGREGVYLFYSTATWRPVPTVQGISDGQWEPVDGDELAAPFELSDGEHSLLVEPERVEVHAPVETFERRGPLGQSRCVEKLLEVDADLVVIGHAVQQGGFEATEAYRGHGFRWVLEAPARGPLLIATAAELSNALRSRLLLVLGRLLPAAVLLGALLLALVSALPWTEVVLPPATPAAGSARTRVVGHPYLNESWRRSPGRRGRAVVRMTYVGFGLLARERLSARVRHELERRGLIGIVGKPRLYRRYGLLFVAEIAGPTVGPQ